MSLDLIDRVLYMHSKGENEPIERFHRWLEDSLKNAGKEFIAEGTIYYWKVISSAEFIDIIDEDETDWFLIFSEDHCFIAIAKINKRDVSNLVEIKYIPGISTLWIIKSNIHSIVIDEIPKLIFTPHIFCYPKEMLDNDFKQLLLKLRNPKVKLMEFILDKKSKNHTRRLR